MDPTQPADRTYWWAGSLLSPPLVATVGFAVAVASPPNTNDWTGVTFMLPIAASAIAGLVCGIIFTVLSVRRKEGRGVVSLIAGAAALYGVLALGSLLVKKLL